MTPGHRLIEPSRRGGLAETWADPSQSVAHRLDERLAQVVELADTGDLKSPGW